MEQQKIDTVKIEQMRRKRIAKKRRLAALLIVIIALVLAYFTGVYGTSMAVLGDVIDTIYSTITKGDGWPVNHAVSNLKNALPIAGGVAILGETDLTIYSPTGKILRNIQHGYGKAAISASSTRVCLYNARGTELKIESRSRTLHKIIYQEPILLAKMAQNGSYAVVTGSTGYQAEMMVYNSLFDKVLQWYAADDMPISLAIDPAGKNVAIGCISPSQGGLDAKTYLFKTGKEEQVAEIIGQDAIPLKMDYLQNGDLVIVYDSFAAIYSSIDGSAVASYDFLGKTLQTAEIGKKEIALVFKGDEKDSVAQLVLLDSSFAQLASATIDTQIQSITLTRENIFAVLPQSVLTYSFEGELLSKTPTTSNGFKIIDENPALLVTNSNVCEIKIEKKK